MKKTKLLINQLLWFKKNYTEKMSVNNELLAKKDLTESDHLFAQKGLLGRINAINTILETEESKMSNSILDEFNLYNHSLAGLEVNLMDKEDENLGLFYFLNGACSVLLLLMTVPENPLSACPKNIEILLSDTLTDLKQDLEFASKVKDADKIKDIKANIKITEELYNKNKLNLQECLT